MKKTVLPKPILVLIAGLPGVGKSTLAFRLGQMLGWVVIEKDKLKEAFFEDSALKEEKIDEETADRVAYHCFFTIAENLLINQGLSVILDSSTLHPFVLKRAKELAACSGANLKIILRDVDEPARQIDYVLVRREFHNPRLIAYQERRLSNLTIFQQTL